MNKLILLLLIPSLLLAETDPVYAPKGFVLTQDSWVFSPDKAKEVRNKLIDLETEQKLNESYKKTLTNHENLYKIEQEKVTILLEQNNKLAYSLNESRSLTDWQKFAYFTLGVAATVLSVYAIQKTIK